MSWLSLWKPFLISLVAASCGRIGFEATAGDGEGDDAGTEPGESLPCTAELESMEPYASGTGEADAPYQICSAAQLLQLVTRSEDAGATFVLSADLDLEGVDFAGIGSPAAPFTGVIEGGGHTIHNMKVTGVAGEPAGFINVAEQAHIFDLNLADATIAAAESVGVGSLLGSCQGSVARNISVSNAQVTGESSVGGIGGALNDCHLLTATLSATVVGTGSEVGGIAGESHKGTILDIEASVEVKAPLASEVGGIVGLEGWSPLLIQNVRVQGTVEGDVDVGGLVGSNSDGALIYRSNFTGTIRGNTGVGGFVGGAYDSPFHVYSTSVHADLFGNQGVGGFSGYHYYRTRFFDSYFRGSITGTGANQAAMGGFWGEVQYYGWVERSYVDVTINSQAPTVGGFAGHIGYWSASSDSYDIADSFSVANVSGVAPADTVSLFVGENLDPNPLVAKGSHYWSGGSCDNTGDGGCGTGGVAVSDITLLQNKGSAPLLAWDFDQVWQEESGALPSLRNPEQVHVPVVSSTCPSVAIVGVRYACNISITDEDPNEGQYLIYARDYSCTWLYLNNQGGSGTASEPGSCVADFFVTDGHHDTETVPIPMEVHAGVLMTPAFFSGSGEHLGFLDIGQTVIQEFTLTNKESVPVTDFSVDAPSAASPFSFDGGSYPGIGGTCADGLGVEESCTIVIRFSPTTVDSFTEDVAIRFTAARGPVSYDFSYSGTGR